jgi:hypothetical protein
MKEGRKVLGSRAIGPDDQDDCRRGNGRCGIACMAKVITTRKKYKAHDDENKCQIGDLVRIVESRPISKEKRWVVTEILERA